MAEEIIEVGNRFSPEPGTTKNEVHLFDNSLLEKLSSWDNISSQLKQNNLIARSLKLSDYDHGYLELLTQLTVVGNVSREQYQRRFHEMKRCNDTFGQYYIVVIEDIATGNIIACSTLFLELKFIHQCASRARLEDVCVLDAHRGKNLGYLTVKIIANMAHEIFDCYKLTLDCSDDLVKFYERNKFKQTALQMAIKYH